MEENQVVNDATPIKKGGVKKIIIAVVVIAVIIAAVVGIINLVKPSPEKTVKEMLKAFGNKKASKVIDCYDFVGAATWTKCAGDYEDFVDEYKDNKEDMEDDIEDYKDSAKEALEEGFDEVDKLKVEIKEIKNAKSVKKAKGLYTVKAKVKVEYKEDDDTERDTSTYNFYVYNVKGKYKIVGIETVSGDGVLTNIF